MTPATVADLPAGERGLLEGACAAFGAGPLCLPLFSMPLTPAIDGELAGRFRDEDELVLTSTTDSYPSHGFVVTVGRRRAAGPVIVNDARCVWAQNFRGVANLGWRLLRSRQHGTRPAGQWRSNRCETLATDFAEGGPLGLLTPVPQVAAYFLTVGLRYGERFASP